MSSSREFEYKGKQVKVSVTQTGRGKYLGVPSIDGSIPKAAELGDDKGSVNEALGEGVRRAKDIIDAQG